MGGSLIAFFQNALTLITGPLGIILTLPKGSGAIAVGDGIFWDNAAKAVTKTATGNTRIGVAVEPAASAGTTVPVRLSGSF